MEWLWFKVAVGIIFIPLLLREGYRAFKERSHPNIANLMGHGDTLELGRIVRASRISEPLKLTAIEALGKLGCTVDPWSSEGGTLRTPALKELQEIAKDTTVPDALRTAALNALSLNRTPKVLATVVALGSGNDNIPQSFRDVASRVQDSVGSELHQINVALRDQNPGVAAGYDRRRSELVEMLGNSGRLDAVPVLRECLAVRRYESDQSRHDIPFAVEAAIAKLEGREASPEYLQGRVNTLLDRFAANRSHNFELENGVAQIGEFAIPTARRWLSEHLHQEWGRAAVIAVEKLAPEIALPLVEDALKSRHDAVRYYAIQYLRSHETNSVSCKRLLKGLAGTEA